MAFWKSLLACAFTSATGAGVGFASVAAASDLSDAAEMLIAVLSVFVKTTLLPLRSIDATSAFLTVFGVVAPSVNDAVASTAARGVVPSWAIVSARAALQAAAMPSMVTPAPWHDLQMAPSTAIVWFVVPGAGVFPLSVAAWSFM
jgi:hypothetical protein